MNGTPVDVLVIDDEPVIRDAIHLVLEGDGLRVAAVASGDAGLAHPALESCRLVFCDLMLPGLPGLDVVREIRRRRPELHIVAITGYATAGSTTRALEAGATEFLAKPFDETELLELTRRALPEADVAGEGGRT
jgi:CheY-like chemotaxis protein